MISDAGEMWLVEGLSDLDAQTRFNASCLLSIHFARLEECLHRYIELISHASLAEFQPPLGR